MGAGAQDWYTSQVEGGPVKFVTTGMLRRILEKAQREVVTVIRPPTKHYAQTFMEVDASTYAPWPGDLVGYRGIQYRVIADP